MKKITFLIFLCSLLAVQVTNGQQTDSPSLFSVSSSEKSFDLDQSVSTRMVACDGVLANYTNSADTGNGLPSQDFEPANDAFDAEAADDFVVPGSGMATICQVDVIGTGGGIPLDPANLVILNIYEDTAGLPGALAFTETFLGTDVDADADGVFGLSPTGADLVSGDTYWLSVVVSMDFGVSGQWFWNTASDGNGSPYVWQNPGGGFGLGCTTWTDGATCGLSVGPDLTMDIGFNELVTIDCTTYDSANVPFDIDGAGDVTADCAGAPNDIDVNVADAGIIGLDTSIDNVTIDIAHTWSGDLTISLVSPGGVELILADALSGNTDDAYNGTMFQDGGADITIATAPFGVGPYAPEGGDFATAFDGEDINGDWSLRICDGASGDTGTVNSFSLTLCEIPTNDDCADAFPIACGDIVTGETINDTDSGANPANDEFYSFTGSGSPQIVTLSLCDGGTDYDSFLRVFEDCTLANELFGNDDACGLQSELTFLSDGTSTYYIMIEGFGSASGNYSLEVSCVDPEPNDTCDGAIDIACGEIAAGSTINASVDTDVAPDCDTSVTANGVWYRYEDTTGLVTDITITMCNGTTDYDAKLSVYTGDCGAPPLTCVVGNDDTCGLQSEVSFQSDGNTTFYILVHGFGGSTGNFEIEMTCIPVPPPNDMIANSIDVDEIGVPYTDPAVPMPAATTEAGNPTGCNIDGANGVWYNFVAEGTGQAWAEVISPAGLTSVTFYTAPNETATEADLTLVPGGQNQCLPGEMALINTVQGQAYYVFVVNTDGITDIVIDGENLGVGDNVIAGFSYYPNPAKNVLNLNSIELIESVEIYNILGQQVIGQTIDATDVRLDVSGLQTGTYIMKASVNGQIGTYKIIKE